MLQGPMTAPATSWQERFDRLSNLTHSLLDGRRLIIASNRGPVQYDLKADGTLGVGNRMKVTISVDHRVSDGAEGAQYLQAFKTLLENPMRMLV